LNKIHTDLSMHHLILPNWMVVEMMERMW